MICPWCEGSGVQVYIERLEDGSTKEFWNECEHCGGTGEIIFFDEANDEESDDDTN